MVVRWLSLYIYYDIIPHLHNSFLFQCDVTRSLDRKKVQTNHLLVQYTSYDKYDSFLIRKYFNGLLKSFLNGFDFRPLMINICLLIKLFVDVILQYLFCLNP